MTLESADHAPIDVDGLQNALESCFLMVMRGIAENDGYNALVLKAGLQWRDIVVIRSISRFLRQVRLPFSQDYMWATLRAHPAIAIANRRAVSRPIRSADRRQQGARRKGSGDRRRDRDRARKGALARRGPYPAPLRQCGAVGHPHQFLPDRRGRPPQAADRDQIRERQADHAAGAAPALRDLRLFAAGRGRASALRQGGARRHPLVRPAAGFPHRSARPGEGAAGQERGDRAGRRQGRLRAQASAGRRRA